MAEPASEFDDDEAEAGHGKAHGGGLGYHKVDNHSGHHEEGEEGEPWLLSYADMVTLLMCFFILFFSMDKTKGGISDPERIKNRLESLIGLDASILAAQPKPQVKNQKDQEVREKKATEIKEKINTDLKQLAKETKVVFSLTTPNPGVIEITFLNTNFFESGQAELTPQGIAMVSKVSPRLSGLGKKAVIEIEGHTDSDPVKSGKFPSNWELSTARASTVARLIITKGISPDEIKVSGYGEFRPLIKESDADGISDLTAKKLNRRITLRVLLPDDDTPENEAETTKVQKAAKDFVPAAAAPKAPVAHSK